jgi:hypothetical protein
VRNLATGGAWLGRSGDLLPGASWSGMLKPSTLTCEVMADGAWRILGLDEAKVAHRAALKRCSACHGRVTIQGVYSGQGYSTLSHRRIHDGCPLIPRHYKGVPSRHPQALK